MNTLAFGMPGGWEWLVIGAVMLLLFGSRLPSVARSIGDALREFKKGVHDMSEDVKSPPRDSNYSSAKPPLTSGGVDQRVSRGVESQPAHSNIDAAEEAESVDAPRE
ncbi:MAG: twin-arginine translocase TatA/TatE family subunit [Phycisphaerales bacterium]|nr:twin-arginine translocase TatA/TatE family subunit [Phycisphaerales bacterium]